MTEEEKEILKHIDSLARLREERDILLAEEHRMSAPMSFDISDADSILACYRDMQMEGEAEIKSPAVMRMVVLFVVLYIFSPRTLTGGRIAVSGLRHRMAQLYHVSDTLISKNTRSVLFYFRRYRVFRQEAMRLYTRVKNNVRLRSRR